MDFNPQVRKRQQQVQQNKKKGLKNKPIEKALTKKLVKQEQRTHDQ